MMSELCILEMTVSWLKMERSRISIEFMFMIVNDIRNFACPEKMSSHHADINCPHFNKYINQHCASVSEKSTSEER